MPALARFSSSTLPCGRRRRAARRPDPLLAFEIRDHAAVGQLFHALHFFVEAHGDAAVAQVIGERFDDFRIGELQQARPLFHQDDAHAERGEHAGVLDADHAAADHDQRLGISGILRIWSLLMMLRPLMGTLGETAGLVPMAMTMFSAS